MKSVRPPIAKLSAKAPTGITGFDEITGGGLPRGRTTLLVGGALADGIFMTLTLIKRVPSPVRRIVGTLSQTKTVLLALGLESYVA